MGTIKRGVSLYSVQHEYATKKLTLDEIFSALKDMGVQGIEVLSDQMIHGAPHPAAETVQAWRARMERFGFESVCNDIFINSTLYRNRRLTLAEQFAMLQDELRCAHALGFHQVRLVSNTDARLVEPVLPLAEELGMTMALEIHAGMSFEAPLTQEYIEVMKRLDHPLVGLVLDMGVFCGRHPRISTEYFRALGLSGAVADYVDAIFARGSDPMRAFAGAVIPDDAKPLIQNKTDEEYLIFCGGYENTPIAMLEEYLPYIKSIHGKCYEMTPDYREETVRYEEVVDCLKRHGWSGYIATEYEGNRFVPVGEEPDSLEQVRRHQEMLKRLCGEGA